MGGIDWAEPRRRLRMFGYWSVSQRNIFGIPKRAVLLLHPFWDCVVDVGINPGYTRPRERCCAVSPSAAALRLTTWGWGVWNDDTNTWWCVKDSKRRAVVESFIIFVKLFLWAATTSQPPMPIEALPTKKLVMALFRTIIWWASRLPPADDDVCAVMWERSERREESGRWKGIIQLHVSDNLSGTSIYAPKNLLSPPLSDDYFDIKSTSTKQPCHRIHHTTCRC